MQIESARIKRHPVMSYFILTFLISWGGVLILGSPYGMPTTVAKFQEVWPIVFVPYFLGPAIAGLVMTGLVGGRAGFRGLWSRLLKWRARIRWYAVALLIAPVLIAGTGFLLSLRSPAYLPAVVTADNKLEMIVMGVVVGLLFGGLLEELGWTGFAVPTHRRSRSLLATGLLVGGLHGLWHVLPTFWATGDETGAISLPDFIPPLFFYAGVLPAYRILMVWLHDNTESLLLSMLMHASLTASAPWILLPAVTGTRLVIYYLVLITAIWIVVALVLRATRSPRRASTAWKGTGSAPG